MVFILKRDKFARSDEILMDDGESMKSTEKEEVYKLYWYIRCR